jgi:hypothetical protein
MMAFSPHSIGESIIFIERQGTAYALRTTGYSSSAHLPGRPTETSIGVPANSRRKRSGKDDPGRSRISELSLSPAHHIL